MSNIPDNEERTDAETAGIFGTEEGNEPEIAEDAESEEQSTIFSAPVVLEKKKRFSPKARGLIILGAVAVIAAAAVAMTYFLSKNSNEGTASETSSAAKVYIDVKKQDINKVSTISVKNAKSSYTLVKKDASAQSIEWLIKGFEDIPMGGTSSVADSSTALVAIKKISTTASNKKIYGLDKPSAVVTVAVKDSDGYTITFGALSPDKTGKYAMVSGDEAVYLIEADTAAVFDTAATDLVSVTAVSPIKASGNNDPYFSDGTLAKFDKILLGGTAREKEIVIECSTDKDAPIPYIITSPGYQAGNSENITNILNVVSTGLTNNGAYVYHPGKADLKKYGLDKPYSTAVYQIGSHTVAVKIGLLSDDGYYAVTVNNDPIIYKIAESSIAWAGYQATDVYYEKLYSESVTKVASVEVKTADKTVLFELTPGEQDNAFTVKAKGKKIEQEQFSFYYQRLLSFSAMEYSTKKLSGEPTIQFTLKYRDTNKASDVIALTKYSERRYLFTINGKGNALVSSDSVEEMVQYLDWLMTGKTIPRA